MRPTEQLWSALWPKRRLFPAYPPSRGPLPPAPRVHNIHEPLWAVQPTELGPPPRAGRAQGRQCHIFFRAIQGLSGAALVLAAPVAGGSVKGPPMLTASRRALPLRAQGQCLARAESVAFTALSTQRGRTTCRPNDARVAHPGLWHSVAVRGALAARPVPFCAAATAAGSAPQTVQK